MGKINGKVSIIVPIYNGEKYIGRCINSLLTQSYKDLEILLIDDGSKDNSPSICDAYAVKDRRIIVYHNSNHGVSYTRNYGLDHATGDYITFIDADDWVENDYVEKLLVSIISNNVSIAMCSFRTDDALGNERIIKTFSSQLLGIRDALNPFSVYFQGAVWAKIFAKEILNDCQGNSIRFDEDIKIGEDRLFWFRVVLKAEKIYADNSPLYHYYINDMGAMRSQKFDAMYTDYLARRRIVELLNKYDELQKINIAESVYTASNVLFVSDATSEVSKVSELQEYISTYRSVFLKCSQFTIKSKIKVMAIRFSLVRKVYKLIEKKLA